MAQIMAAQLAEGGMIVAALMPPRLAGRELRLGAVP